MVQIVPRAAWGAKDPRKPPTRLTNHSQGWFIHWAGTDYGPAIGDPQKLRSIQAYHQGPKGWNDIAYSFAIGPDHPELVYECRGWEAQGAHTEGYNATSLAVCFLFGPSTQPAPETLAIMQQTCVALLAEKPGPVRPHRAVRQTDCPGETLASWVAGLPTQGDTMATKADPQVKAWQEALLTVGADLGPAGADGIFGPKTLAAGTTVLAQLVQVQTLAATVGKGLTSVASDLVTIANQLGA